MNDYLQARIRAMAGYVPGEQPRDGAFVKLNTNENPYPPSPRVFDALRAALTGDRLRKYPDPLGVEFRQTAGRVLGVDPDGILIGNGSDDILTIVTRAFVPEGGLVVSPTPSTRPAVWRKWVPSGSGYLRSRSLVSVARMASKTHGDGG